MRMPRLIAAVVAVVLVSVLIIVSATSRPLGFDPRGLGDQPHVTLGAVAVAGVIAWALGRAVADGGWLRTVLVGMSLGVLWTPVAVMTAVAGGIVDATLRGAANPVAEIGPGMAWGLFGAVYVSIYALIVAIPVGLAWSVVAGLLIRIAARSDAVDVSSSGWSNLGRSCAALVVIAFAGGAFQAVTTAPAGARCLDLGAGDVTDAAFSPAGDLLAATVQTDPNEPGVVLLLRWPSAEILGSWEEWVDQDVAVGPDGRVYWSAWELSGVATADAPGDGVFVAAVGSAPRWHASGFETPLNDLTWTDGALRGTTPNSHAMARIPLDGAVPRLVIDDEAVVGAFWTSSDGMWMAVGPGWLGEDVQVSRGGHPWRTVDTGTDPRSIALSGDRSTLVVASWFEGTRLVEVASGASRRVLRGSQRFVALSEQGDLAWASEEEFGQSRLCTTTLEKLGPATGE